MKKGKLKTVDDFLIVIRKAKRKGEFKGTTNKTLQGWSLSQVQMDRKSY